MLYEELNQDGPTPGLVRGAGAGSQQASSWEFDSWSPPPPHPTSCGATCQPASAHHTSGITQSWSLPLGAAMELTPEPQNKLWQSHRE
ncbi:unnamed protein product [Merluccius merluccius]